MSEENSGILVGRQESTMIIRVQGKGTHLNSHLLKKFLIQSFLEKQLSYQIDLSLCTYMDSTFLGMLAGVGSRLKEQKLAPIRLLNATQRVREMIEGLGIDHLFEITQDAKIGEELSPLPDDQISMDQKSSQMLEAHENLISVSKDNEAKFRDVIALLREAVNQPKPK